MEDRKAESIRFSYIHVHRTLSRWGLAVRGRSILVGGARRHSKMANSYLVGVDVGTGSVRAALFTEGGRMVEHSSRAVKTWYDQGHSEQSTADIWAAVCSCVQVCCTMGYSIK